MRVPLPTSDGRAGLLGRLLLTAAAGARGHAAALATATTAATLATEAATATVAAATAIATLAVSTVAARHGLEAVVRGRGRSSLGLGLLLGFDGSLGVGRLGNGLGLRERRAEGDGNLLDLRD